MNSTVPDGVRGLPKGWRKCEFCGCETNAKLRACCDRGKDADEFAAQERRLVAEDDGGVSVADGETFSRKPPTVEK